MYELWYWCWQKNEWRPVGGTEYTDWVSAAREAETMAIRSGRAILVRDAYTGEVLHQTGSVGYQPDTLPAVWA